MSPRTHLALFQPSPKRSSLTFLSSPAAPLSNSDGFVFAVTPTHLKGEDLDKALEVGALSTALPSAPPGSSERLSYLLQQANTSIEAQSFVISPIKVSPLSMPPVPLLIYPYSLQPRSLASGPHSKTRPAPFPKMTSEDWTPSLYSASMIPMEPPMHPQAPPTHPLAEPMDTGGYMGSHLQPSLTLTSFPGISSLTTNLPLPLGSSLQPPQRERGSKARHPSSRKGDPPEGLDPDPMNPMEMEVYPLYNNERGGGGEEEEEEDKEDQNDKAQGGKKRSNSMMEPDDGKHCNCKKSLCLKLYCDCFSAQMYCMNCACVGCLNTPDNANVVNEKRIHIKSRDPLVSLDPLPPFSATLHPSSFIWHPADSHILSTSFPLVRHLRSRSKGLMEVTKRAATARGPSASKSTANASRDRFHAGTTVSASSAGTCRRQAVERQEEEELGS